MKVKILLLGLLLCALSPIQSFSSEAYPQYGNASWYGGKFHGRKTASGERFNKYEFTAAHRKLPFGTIVRVTNLRNGKDVYVRINDRGPFIKGRILDLSLASAEALHFNRRGVIRVRIDIISLPGDAA
ncbi:MAG: septal ring lytic transglycosylase RlpA family protein [Thermodesulfobacteriota bacterium]